jgi:hypothetical protein
LLENYDLGSQYFSGVVIENRGRQNQTSINLIISNLSSEITAINFPGTHESMNITSGGINNNAVTIEMPRLSVGNTLSVYLISSHPINLSNSNLLLSSMEAVGQPSSEIVSAISIGTTAAATISIFSAFFATWNLITLWRSVNKRKDAEYDAMQKVLELIGRQEQLDNRIDEAETQVNEVSEGFEVLTSDSQKISKIFDSMLVTLQSDAKNISELHEMIQQAIVIGKLKSGNKTDRLMQMLENIQNKTNEKLKVIDGIAKMTRDFIDNIDM